MANEKDFMVYFEKAAQSVGRNESLSRFNDRDYESSLSSVKSRRMPSLPSEFNERSKKFIAILLGFKLALSFKNASRFLKTFVETYTDIKTSRVSRFLLSAKKSEALSVFGDKREEIEKALSSFESAILRLNENFNSLLNKAQTFIDSIKLSSFVTGLIFEKYAQDFAARKYANESNENSNKSKVKNSISQWKNSVGRPGDASIPYASFLLMTPSINYSICEYFLANLADDILKNIDEEESKSNFNNFLKEVSAHKQNSMDLVIKADKYISEVLMGYEKNSSNEEK